MRPDGRRTLDPVRAATRVAAGAVGAACIGYALTLAGDVRSASLFAGAAAVGILAAVILVRTWTATAAMALVAITYCFAILNSDRGLDASAPLVGLGILLLGELLDLAHAGGEGRLTDRAVWSARMIFVLAIAAVGAATAQFALLIGGSARGTGPVLLLVAVSASLAALVAILRLVRSLLTPSAGRGAADPGDAPPSRER
jgi:hypothetical protein